MRKIVLLMVCGLIMNQRESLAQGRKCGAQIVKEILTAKDPSYPIRVQHQKEHIALQAKAYAANSSKFKTTGSIKIPVVFHIVLNTAGQNQLGGINGIRQRAISQIATLNKDFNNLNTDLIAVPAGFVPLIGNPQIEFGLAHRKPDGSATEGFEIITTTAANYSINDLAVNAKHSSTGGADTWDPMKYLNIWVVNLGSGGILGFTLVPQFATPTAEDGIVITHGAFGAKAAVGEYYLNGIDKGRTLTHEIGHYFKLDHIWGDDGGACPAGTGGNDDGFTDTPPQANYTYNSNHPGGNIPFPLFDGCTTSGNGIMWMNFMDYVNDAWMYMFTKQQSAYMRAALAVGVFPLSLTEHPEIFDWPTDVAEIEKKSGLNIFPNPSRGNFTISFKDADGLESINVINFVGQQVRTLRVDNSPINNYNIDLTGLSKGVYMVQCTFEMGTVTRKIVLQ